MRKFITKRLQFQNGERHSVLLRPGGLPVHEATLYLAKYRKRGRAANTIHAVCTELAWLYRHLDAMGIDLLPRLRQGRFLTIIELNRLADNAQYRATSLSDEDIVALNDNVVNINRIRMRRKSTIEAVSAVNMATQATRLRYVADYLEFLSTYVGATLSPAIRKDLAFESEAALKVLLAQVPPVSKRVKLGAREGLSKEEQNKLLKIIHPDSVENPWKREFIRQRKWLIILLLLATGMRRGELLGMQIRDLDQRLPKLRIIRRADAIEDPRLTQPNTKTNDREVELRPPIMRAVWSYINNHRNKIKTARKYPQLIVADDGQPLSLKSIDKIFVHLRNACPGLPVTLTSHVMRHTWNERFSEQAELLGLTDVVEQRLGLMSLAAQKIAYKALPVRGAEKKNLRP
jgi:integrase